MKNINSKHIVFIILATCIVSLKTYPNIIIKYSGRDAWISVIIASALVLLFSVYILWICKKTNCYDLNKIYTSSLGYSFGNLFIIFYCFTLFLTLLESACISTSAVHGNLLIETPPWYILIFFICTSFYAVFKGFDGIIIITIVGICFVMLAGINLGFLTMKYKNYKYIFPIMANGLDFKFFISILRALGCYSFVSIFLPYVNNVDDKGNLIKTSIIGLLIVIQMEIVSMTGVIATFGPERTLNIIYPKLLQTQLVSVFHFLESGEFFVMLQTVGGWFMKYILTFYAILLVMKNIKANKNYFIIILSLITFTLSYLIVRNNFFMLKVLDYFNYICLVNFIIIPFIIFTIYLLRFKSSEKKSK